MQPYSEETDMNMIEMQREQMESVNGYKLLWGRSPCPFDLRIQDIEEFSDQLLEDLDGIEPETIEEAELKQKFQEYLEQSKTIAVSDNVILHPNIYASIRFMEVE